MGYRRGRLRYLDRWVTVEVLIFEILQYVRGFDMGGALFFAQKFQSATSFAWQFAVRVLQHVRTIGAHVRRQIRLADFSIMQVFPFLQNLIVFVVVAGAFETSQRRLRRNRLQTQKAQQNSGLPMDLGKMKNHVAP